MRREARSFDAIVVGSGIVGAATAAALARTGASVAVVTGGKHAAVSATAASAGLVRCYETDPFLRTLAVRSHHLLWRHAGTRIGHRACGSLVCLTEDEADKAGLVVEELAAAGVTAQLLTPRQITRRWPGLRSKGIVAGLWEPSGGYADPARTAAVLLAEARRHGVTVIDDRIRGLVLDGRRVTGVGTTRGPLGATAVVLAAGSRSPGLLPPGVGTALRTRRVRYAYVEWTAGAVPALTDQVTGMWGRPHGDDRLLVGRPVDEWNAVPQVGTTITGDQLDHIRHGGVPRWPALADARFTGARWGTDLWSPVGPLLGPVDTHPGLVLATAWSGAGFRTAPAAGEVAATAVLDLLDLLQGG